MKTNDKMLKLSTEEITHILQDADDPHIKAVLRMIKNRADPASALLIGIVSLAMEREQYVKKFNDMEIQRNMPKTSDLS